MGKEQDVISISKGRICCWECGKRIKNGSPYTTKMISGKVNGSPKVETGHFHIECQ
jgi:hypothetical protein